MCVLTVVELYDLTSKLAILQDLEGTIFFPPQKYKDVASNY